MMIIATVLTALFTILMIFGVRVVARYMLVTFVVVWVGMIAWLVTMAVGSHAHFVAHLERHVRHDLRRASSPRPATSASARRAPSAWGATLFGMIYSFQVYTGLPVDRVLRRGDPQRPAHRHHLDPRRRC